MPEAWFTVSATTPPSELHWSYEEGGHRTTERVQALLVQQQYPVDDFGERIPGADWTDTRVVAGIPDVGATIASVELVHPNGFLVDE